MRRCISSCEYVGTLISHGTCKSPSAAPIPRRGSVWLVRGQTKYRVRSSHTLLRGGATPPNPGFAEICDNLVEIFIALRKDLFFNYSYPINP
jgi:hypothetical protein